MFQNLLGHQGKIVNVDHSHRLSSFHAGADVNAVKANVEALMNIYPAETSLTVAMNMYDFLSAALTEGVNSDSSAVVAARDKLLGPSKRVSARVAAVPMGQLQELKGQMDMVREQMETAALGRSFGGISKRPHFYKNLNRAQKRSVDKRMIVEERKKEAYDDTLMKKILAGIIIGFAVLLYDLGREMQGNMLTMAFRNAHQ
jgi:hypothetical protein